MAISFITDTYNQIRNMKFRKMCIQGISLGMIVGSALMIWKFLMIISLCESPVVVVLSGSMEPAYYRGDILFLTWWDEPIVSGDVVVYKLGYQDIPIVHRIISVQDKENEDIYVLTKGDNNPVDDRGLYESKQVWLHKKDLMGKIRGYLPYMGYFTILLNDYVWIKYIVIGGMCLLVLIAKDPQS